jgi:hypothetical protein
MSYFILRPIKVSDKAVTYKVQNKHPYKSRVSAIQDSNALYGRQTIVVHESELPRFLSVNEMIYVWGKPTH